MHIDIIAICRSTLYNLRKSKTITNELILDTNASEYDSIQKLVYNLWLFSGLFMLIAGILFGLMFK
jgi:thiosulfate reductase cytochrome b subunit